MWNQKLNYLMDHILHQIFKFILSISSKNIKDGLVIFQRIYVNKIEYRIMFKIKTGHDLELLTPETIKLLIKITIKLH